MLDLSIEAIGVAFQQRAAYRPVAALDATDDLLPLASKVAEFSGIPLERLWMLAPDVGPDGQAADVGTLALAALGPPARDQPLFLVRSGPQRDPYVVELARLVHETGWTGEDVGITHLDELGGTVVFNLLDWAVPERTVATALICDDPLFTDALKGSTSVAAVSLRVRRGPGPLRVLGCGEGAPGAAGQDVDVHITGRGACEGWLAVHAALTAGQISDGDQVLMHTRGPAREGWLSMAVVETAGLLLCGEAASASRVA